MIIRRAVAIKIESAPLAIFRELSLVAPAEGQSQLP